MKLILLLGTFMLAVHASKIDSLKSKILMDAQVGALGPFRTHSNTLLAKVSKEGKPVDLPKNRQIGSWNLVEGNALVEAWSVSEEGIRIKRKSGEVPCKSVHGMDTSVSVSISFSCMMESAAVLHARDPAWPIKTGYDAQEGQDNPNAGPYDAEDKMDWDPRVRFWHRCEGGGNNGLSLCSRYSYIGADAQGYYGCDFLTEDEYCVQSFRHEWAEFNPNDLPNNYNPASACAGDPCKDCGDCKHIPK